MDFLSSDIVSDNIVSDYPVLRKSEMFAKLSLSLFSTDIETCPLLFFTFSKLTEKFFSKTCVFLLFLSKDRRRTHLLKVSNLPLAKAKTIAMFVLFKFQTYSIFCLTKFPRNIYIQKRAEPPESEKPNGSSIARESAKSRFNEVTS